MTHMERLSIVPGDTVLVRDDFGGEGTYDVTRSPWRLGHGAWVLGLTGISGGYSLDRVVRIVYPTTDLERIAETARLRCAIACLREDLAGKR